MEPISERVVVDRAMTTKPPLPAELDTLRNDGVRPAFQESPIGVPVQVAQGIYWIRLPLEGMVDHVNVYALEDDDGWVLVDTGTNSDACRSAISDAFQHAPFSDRPITKVIVTHYHHDHIGLAGWLVDQGASLFATQVCWLCARMLQLDSRERPCKEEIRFIERAGMNGVELAAFLRRPPSNYANAVSTIPYAYHRIEQDQTLRIGDRTWMVHIGHGHAEHHATLWSDDGIAISGDQFLAGTASNISVHPSEPHVDLVKKWLESCERFMKLADSETLCLPGHNLPYRGIPARCAQLISSQQSVLLRLLDLLDKPKTAIECLNTLYRRTLAPKERETLIAEAVGFLNHLQVQGLIQSELLGDKVTLWRKPPVTRTPLGKK
jgi:glyoxylase-like metal-dependent hydrolase (beta-lactamase superfamily II)